MGKMDDGINGSSFRDPSGFLFSKNNILYRQINDRYKPDYELLIKSGLYKELTDRGDLIPHDEVDISLKVSDDAYKIICPEFIPFISYPYEWCFSELKDAALLTLNIQKMALQHGMSLKDANAYNIQFVRGKPVFIDTLSFEQYREDIPWFAYLQFCQHFLAPLTLMKYKDLRCNQWFKINMDGIPLDLASKLLPVSTRFGLKTLFHIHVHAWSQKHYSQRSISKKKRKKKFSKFSFLALIDSLESAVQKLKWKPKGTEWADYYSDTNYTDNAQLHKKQLVSEFIDAERPKSLWDIGANEGTFSRIASDKGIHTIAFDIDPACVEMNYLEVRKHVETNMLPLLLDVTNPSPGIGWNNCERMSLISRGPTECLLALALIHHLAISHNVPLQNIAMFFSNICGSLIIEWIPKEDSQVKRLFTVRDDIFDDYTQESFEKNFKNYFEIVKSVSIRESMRVLYLMKTLRNT